MTENRLYKVFISSTYNDLKEARRKVALAIMKMGNLPCGMELFNASNNNQWKVITDTIDEADYYVLIIGRRYGSTFEDGISYTEREFKYAIDQGIPCLAFLKDNSFLGSYKHEGKKKQESLKAFRSLVETDRTVNYWENTDELAEKVRSSLEYEIRHNFRPGWHRNYQIESSSFSNQLLAGRLLYSFIIGHEIYDILAGTEDIFVKGNIVNKARLVYGVGTQGSFRLALEVGDVVKDFYPDTPEEFISETDGFELIQECKLQLALAVLGNIDEVLAFYSVGDRLEMVTAVFRIDSKEIKKIGSIRGYEQMYIDYSINVPFGSQGLFDRYVYCDGQIFKTEEINYMN